ncbi:hypothetical protein CAPN002_11900 [Capnocytophaga stomatis]|uniref:Imm51 family immunity protein n=1 Tax=Capnocytophaga stomatis TaxID=1848904 RepID=UPI00194DB317|nr:Imm51 family immunity protein [Capnocytophaga stomatis]GIJ93972.1 hypothetical protein CAPN002_11900 [Capnocytophaga stomatis]
MKITDSELQRNDLSSLAFFGAANYNVKNIREDIEHYKTLDKIRTSIFGNIKALSLLCEHFDGGDNPIMTEEAQQWKVILLDYCERNKRKIPKALRDDFLQNLTNDLDTIINNSIDIPDFLWKSDAQKREIVVKVKNQALKDKYIALAELKYSKLGGALQNYLLECLQKLEEKEEASEEQTISRKKTRSFCPHIFASSDNEYTFLLDDFDIFLTEKRHSEDTEINAYDIEKQLKEYLKETNKPLLEKLFFDCESSLFSVRSQNLENLIQLQKALLHLAFDNQ